MTLQEAFRLFGITQLLQGRELTKLYHTKMKVAHPDAGGNIDEAILLNAAYTLLQNYKAEEELPDFNSKEMDDYFDKLRAKKKEFTIFIPFETYLRYLEGEMIECLFKGSSVYLKKGIPNEYQLGVQFEVKVCLSVDNEEQEWSKILYGLPSINGKIQTSIVIPRYYPQSLHLSVTVMGKTYKLTTNHQEVTFEFGFNKCYIYVHVAQESMGFGHKKDT